MPVRVSTKAIILDQGAVLLLAMHDDLGPYFMLPGGGQESGEDLHSTVRRECREEIGAEVEVGDLVLVRDYIEAHHEYAYKKSGFHQVDLFFRCTMRDPSSAQMGALPDERQLGVKWMPLSELATVRVFPNCLATEIPRLAAGRPGKVYLGDVN